MARNEEMLLSSSIALVCSVVQGVVLCYGIQYYSRGATEFYQTRCYISDKNDPERSTRISEVPHSSLVYIQARGVQQVLAEMVSKK